MDSNKMAAKALELMKEVLAQANADAFEYDCRETFDRFANNLVVKGSEIMDTECYAPKKKNEAFQKVYDLMFVDNGSKNHCLKGKLDFSHIAPDFDIQSVECTGHRMERNFHFETNGKPIVEVVERLAKMNQERV